MTRFGSHRQPSNVRTDWPVAADAAAQNLARPVQSQLTAGVRHEHGARSFWQDIADVLATAPSETGQHQSMPMQAAVIGAVRSAVLHLERPPFVWGGLGFITGILAWHVIGFWGLCFHHCVQSCHIEQLNFAARDVKQSQLVEARENTTHGLERQTKKAANLSAGHAQHKALCGKAASRESLREIK